MTTAKELAQLLDRAHANLDAHPDEYPPRRPQRRPRRRTPQRRVSERSYTYLTAAGRDEAIERARNGETYSAIARSMGLSHSTIRRAVLGITQERHTR